VTDDTVETLAIGNLNGEFFCEQFLDPASRSRATGDLARFGAEAVPVLAAFFRGETSNRFGVPYYRLGQSVDCALVVVTMLGPTARPLEPYVVVELRHGHPYAPSALGALGSLEELSVIALADRLGEKGELAYHSAVALVQCAATHHPYVEAVVNASSAAAGTIAAATARA